MNAYIFKGKIGINPQKIITIFLTHTDGDHIPATELFKNAVIYLNRDEEQMINGTTGKTKYFSLDTQPDEILSDCEKVLSLFKGISLPAPNIE